MLLLGVAVDKNSSPEERASILRTTVTERTWITWIDHSVIANKGYLLGTMQEVWNRRFYFTSEEMKSRGSNIDVQAVVEEPEVE